MADQNQIRVADRRPLNEVRYANRDFPSLVDALNRKIKDNYEKVYNDFTTTSLGMMLVDLTGWSYAELSWYLDRTASDCFLSTARTRSAVERLVEQIGYKMGAAAASSTNVRVTFPDGTPGPVTLKKGFRFQGPNGLTFESYAETAISSALLPGNDDTVIAVRQGESRSVSYVSDGSKNQVYRLTSIQTDRFLGVGSVKVYVDHVLWTERPFLEFTTNPIYEISYLNDPPLIRFGDGIAGPIPAINAPIQIDFLVVDGAKGNVKSNTINSAIDTVRYGTTTVNISVTNEDGANGGTDPEESSSAKRLGPVSFAARGAALTQQDYEALAASYVDVSYGRVAKAYAVNPRTPYSDLLFNAKAEQLSGFVTAFTVDSIAMAESVTERGNTISEDVVASSSSLEAIGVSVTKILDGSESIKSSLEDSIAESLKLTTGATASGTFLQSALTAIDLLMPDLSAGSQDDLNVIRRLVQSAQTEAGAMGYSAGSVNDLCTLAYDQNNANIEEINNENGIVAQTAIVLNGLEETDLMMNEDVDGINPQLATLTEKSTELQTSVDGCISELKSRMGELFADDCKSNYVQVPILALDVDGKYAAPSVGLTRGLQAHLNAIKGVTQVVQVVDGSLSLVRAIIRIKLSVLESFVGDEVKAQVAAAITDLMKGRDYNQPLYLSDLYDAALESSRGINRINIEIVGPTETPPVIDEDGDLVPNAGRVIVLESLDIVVEPIKVGA